MLRKMLLGTTMMAAVTMLALMSAQPGDVMAEGGGSFPLPGLDVEVWIDGDNDQTYGEQVDTLVSTTQTQLVLVGGEYRAIWEVPIGHLAAGSELGVIIEYDLSSDLQELVPCDHVAPPTTLCKRIGGDIYAYDIGQSEAYYNGLRTKNQRDVNVNGLFEAIPLEIFDEMDTEPILPGEGDYRLEAEADNPPKFAVVLDVGTAADGKDVLAGRVFEPTPNQ